jgi:hypothetical protein
MEARTMSADQVRLVRTSRCVGFAWLDSQGEALPVECHFRAWRPYTYRRPLFDTAREPLSIPEMFTARTNAPTMLVRFA